MCADAGREGDGRSLGLFLCACVSVHLCVCVGGGVRTCVSLRVSVHVCAFVHVCALVLSFLEDPHLRCNTAHCIRSMWVSWDLDGSEPQVKAPRPPHTCTDVHTHAHACTQPNVSSGRLTSLQIIYHTVMALMISLPLLISPLKGFVLDSQSQACSPRTHMHVSHILKLILV